jgi:hypothetical protein
MLMDDEAVIDVPMLASWIERLLTPGTDDRQPNRRAIEVAREISEVRNKLIRASQEAVRMTEDEAVIACENIGYDLTCGACAERFFTGGSWGSEHDTSCATIPALKIRNEVTITSIPLEKAADRP